MWKRISSVLCVVLISILVEVTASPASSVAKKEITPEDYDQWNTIVAPLLSDDGKWVVYTLASATGAGELIVRGAQTDVEFRVQRGFVPRINSVSEYVMHRDRSSELWPTRISADSRFVMFDIQSADRAIAGNGSSVRAYKGLGIMSLPGGQVTEIGGVSAFAMPKSSGRFLAYVLSKEGADELKTPFSALAASTVQVAPPKTLVLRELETAKELQIADVLDFAFDDEGRYLAYIVVSPNRTLSGAYVRRLSDGRVTPLLTGPGNYRSLIFDESGKQLAFLSDRQSPTQEGSHYSIYYARSPLSPAHEVVPHTELPEGFMVSPGSGVRFTRASNALIFHFERIPSDESRTNLRAQYSSLQIWRWSDASPNRTETQAPREYLAVHHIQQGRSVRLGSPSIRHVLLTDDARFAAGLDYAPYAVPNTWSERMADLYVIDTQTGQPHLLRSGLNLQSVPKPDQPWRLDRLILSPGGRYMIYFEDRRWWSYDFVKGELVDMTGALMPATRFDTAASWSVRMVADPGITGWTSGDRRVLLYAQRDIWEVDPAGVTAPRNITAGIGDKEDIVFRLWQDFGTALNYPASGSAQDFLPRSTPFVDVDQPLLLIALDLKTMRSGVWRAEIGTSASPEKLFMVDKRITPIAQAKHTSQYLVSLQTFREYPDLWIGQRFDQLKRVSHANPQQQLYRWGTGELIEFTSKLGVPLKGRLYKPDGFDPKKKYPMIVSIYEEHSSLLHLYSTPAPMHWPRMAEENWPEVLSKGYLYFVPDIRSTAPFPGQSALASVEPALEAIIDRGFVDPQRIGLIGFSFGAYQVNYIITQTNRFRCAISSAGLSDTITLYGNSDPNYSAKFVEIGQLRHGASIWRAPFVYIANSPVFHADHVQTPVLIMHNDKDHIPYTQSVEFFTALRRNGKEAYLLNYSGEGHGLYKYLNRLDWDRRVYEFLDYCLKDAPKPQWLDSNKEDDRNLRDERLSGHARRF